MRILLLSCNTGEGHNSTARAIMEVMEKEGAQCELKDVLQCLSPRFSKFICNSHARIYKYAPKLFDAGYRGMELFNPDPDELNLVYELLSLGAGKLRSLVLAGNYDAVICVHAFAGMMMTEVRRHYAVKLPCFFVATDYTCSPTVERCEMDGYFIPHRALAEEFVRSGLPGDRLIPSGIPVRQAFYSRADRDSARQLLDLPPEGLVVLLMCGSMGCGPMKRIALDLIEALPEETTVVAICGNNEKLYESLAEVMDPRLRVLGFTREISAYMDAADMIVTKPGGLSTTEAAAKGLPMVLFNAVGGCEAPNFQFFCQRGCAVGSSDAGEVVRQAALLAEDPARRAKMRQRLAEEFSGNSAASLAGHVLELALQYRGTEAGIQAPVSGHPSHEEGGCDMNQLRRDTIINLARSFAGESQARTRYTVYAQVARKEGNEWIARVFEETAANEAVHAEEFLEMLQKLGGCAPNIDLSAGYPFELGTTAENLQFAADGERHEHDAAYPEFAEIARREGFDDAARLWMQIARIEGVHHNTFAQLHEQLVTGRLTEKEEPIQWRCLNCGYTYEGIRACDPCPVCKKEAGWQEGELDRKKMLSKK